MNKPWLLIVPAVALFAFWNSDALAQQPSASAASQRELTSAEYRARTTVVLVAGPLLSFPPGLGFDGVLGAHVLPNTLVELDAAWLHPESWARLNGGTAASVGLGVRQFLGDFFNVRLGMRIRHLEETESPGDKLDFRTPNYWTVWDTGLDFALGNRWQWQNATLGIDWFGMYTPVYRISGETQATNLNTGVQESWAGVKGESSSFDAMDADVRLLHVYAGVWF